ncbi:MAG: polyphenol oxidase family protein, partial [Acidimicrobiales bacterium]
MPDRFRRAGGLTVLHWPALDALGVDAVVTTRHGGVSTGPYGSLNLGLHVGDDPAAVVENRRRAAAAIGAALGDLVVAEQVHGSAATVVGREARGRGTLDAGDAVPATDALVTAAPGTVLVTLVADCVPVVLFDPAARVLATVHAGWRGTAGRVVAAAVDAMTALGARPA